MISPSDINHQSNYRKPQGEDRHKAESSDLKTGERRTGEGGGGGGGVAGWNRKKYPSEIMI